tara:strand:+ start:84 stop:545 length:462 start_codon:yes stop_codon:yes gene_type:complete
MAMKDLANNLTVLQLVDPATITSDTNSTSVDTQFDNGVMLIVNVGESGDTLSGSVKFDYVLEDSSDDSTFAAVTDTKFVTYGTVDSSGIFATIDAAAEDDAVHKIGYVGPNRYVRVKIDATGSHSNGTPHSVSGVVDPIHKPSSGGNDGSPTG